MTRRHNGEGSIYPVKDSHGRVTGYRGYVWCTKPGGERYRKYVKGAMLETCGSAGKGDMKGVYLPGDRVVEVSSKWPALERWLGRYTRA